MNECSSHDEANYHLETTSDSAFFNIYEKRGIGWNNWKNGKLVCVSVHENGEWEIR